VKEIRLVLADDHPVFREGLQAVLASAPGIVVVGESESGSGALAMCRDLRPDVVLMDIQMEDLNGIEATRQLVAEQPEVGVLMLTMFEDDESVFAAMRAGARGYLLKGSGRSNDVTLSVKIPLSPWRWNTDPATLAWVWNGEGSEEAALDALRSSLN